MANVEDVVKRLQDATLPQLNYVHYKFGQGQWRTTKPDDMALLEKLIGKDGYTIKRMIWGQQVLLSIPAVIAVQSVLYNKAHDSLYKGRIRVVTRGPDGHEVSYWEDKGD